MSVASQTSPFTTPLARQREDSMRLAVMGDLHMYRLWVPPWRLLSKRIMGQINLWWDRRKTFDRRLLRPMLEHVLAVAPDLFLLTGDLTMTGLREEFEDVRAALSIIEGKAPMLAIAGNHDRYTPFSRRRKIMEKHLPGLVPDAFPFFTSLSPRWKLLAIDAAMPRLLTARGVIGRKQLEAIAAHISTLTAEQGLIVMCHYPAIPKPDGSATLWNHRLADAPALLNILRQCAAPIIYLHGHVHQPWRIEMPAQGLERMIDLNVGAPIMRRTGYPHGQGFWQLDLPESPPSPVTFTHHVPIGVNYDAGAPPGAPPGARPGAATIEWETRVESA
ncbi:MAG: metallophosphoesterase [Phycisphaeraceae bacterium]